MTGIQPRIVNFSTKQPKTSPKSKFLKVGNNFYLNPDQVGIIIHGKKPNSTVVLSSNTTKMVTLTNALPEEVVKAFDRMA